MREMMRGSAKWLAAAGVATTGFLLAGPSLTASAAPPYGPSGGVPGFGSVVGDVLLASGSGTATCMINGATVTVTVPAGDFTGPVDVICQTGAAPTGLTDVELTFAVALFQHEVKAAGPFTAPIGVTAADPAITAGATVNRFSGTTFAPDPAFTATAGMATGSFTTDPSWAITGAAATTATPPAAAPTTTAPSTVPGATSAVTGKPLIGEGAAAGALVLGGLGVWRLRRGRAGAGWRR